MGTGGTWRALFLKRGLMIFTGVWSFGNRRLDSVPSDRRPKVNAKFLRLLPFSIALTLAANAFPQEKSETIPHDTGSDLLWKKLETRVEDIAARLDGVMGVAILDLTDSRILLHNADRVFPTASSIKIAILLELYRQNQEAHSGAKGKAQLDDFYTFDPKDLVEDSRIMAGLTPSVTRVTNRDLAQFMVAVSDNAAANILIDRVGKDNINAMLHSLGLSKTMLRRKMIDIAAARRGDENVATPQEMVRLLEATYRGKVLISRLPRNSSDSYRQRRTVTFREIFRTTLRSPTSRENWRVCEQIQELFMCGTGPLPSV